VYASATISKNNSYAVLLRLDDKGDVIEPADWDVMQLEQRTCLGGRVMGLNVSNKRHKMAADVLGKIPLAQIVAEKHAGDITRGEPAPAVEEKRKRKQITRFEVEMTPKREKVRSSSRKGQRISPAPKVSPASSNGFINFRREELTR
jgi:hypothetical protein